MQKILITTNVLTGIGDFAHFSCFVQRLHEAQPVTLYALILIPAGNQPAVLKCHEWLCTQPYLRKENVFLILDSQSYSRSYRSFDSLSDTDSKESKYMDFIKEHYSQNINPDPEAIISKLGKIVNQIIQISLPFEKSRFPRFELSGKVHDALVKLQQPTIVIHEFHAQEAIQQMAPYCKEEVNYFMGFNEHPACIGLPKPKQSRDFLIPQQLGQILFGQNIHITDPNHPGINQYQSRRLMSPGYLPAGPHYSQLFILFAIKAHPEKEGWDFYLNPECFKDNFRSEQSMFGLRDFLKTHGIEREIAFVSPGQMNNSAIRIFSEFDLNDVAYHSLQKISQLSIGCAGDASMIDALYYGPLPFFTHEYSFKMDINAEFKKHADKLELTLLAKYFHMLHTINHSTLPFRYKTLHPKTIQDLHAICSNIEGLKAQWQILKTDMIPRFETKYNDWIEDQILSKMSHRNHAPLSLAPSKL